MLRAMLPPRIFPVLALMLGLLAVPMRGLAAEPPLPSHFHLTKLQTSFLAGSVTLITSVFTLSGGVYIATYECKVVPWSFENEAGAIALRIPPADYQRMRRGEAVHLTGQAKTTTGKTRQVSVRARPSNEISGKANVRVVADGVNWVFNGSYRTSPP